MMINFFLLPLQGSFKPGQDILFQLVLADSDQLEFPLKINLKIWHIFNPVDDLVEIINNAGNLSDLILSWSPPAGIKGGFGVQCELTDSGGCLLGSATTAFDIQNDWAEFPRYGFLSDFFPDRDDVEPTLKKLLRFHVNGLQYYDWQYRHDQLISPKNNYLDPLGRELSLETINNFLHQCKRYGIKSMPYMAVYAASLDFWKEHPEWAMYDMEGKPLYFEDFLGIMDPSSKSPWIEHIKGECDNVLNRLPFDGIHIDQYGDPKEGTNASGDILDIPASFKEFIDDLKSLYPQKTILFNAVGNWPIETLATSKQDFLYIEVWPPNTKYQDLAEIVTNARQLSKGKPVVIAVYISSAHEANVRLADAFIFASGGTRIEIGEGERLLADPYFPKHETISPTLSSTLLRYYDFLVCYGDLIGPSVQRKLNHSCKSPSEIFTTVCPGENLLTVCLVNQAGISELNWNENHSAPTVQTDFDINVRSPKKVNEVWWGSPDQMNWKLAPVKWTQKGNACQVHIPNLEIWGIIVITFN